MEGLAWGWFILAYIAASTWVPAGIGRVLAGIGRTSFSIYLLHVPVIDVLSLHRWVLRPTGNPYWDALATTALLVLPLVLAVAAFSYATIEAPFLGLRRRYVG